MDEPFGPVMDLAEWKTKAQAGDDLPDVVLHKDVGAEIKTDNDTVSFTISTEAPDRDKDVIKADGWELGNFQKNPVVLWAHDYRSLPIGKAVSVTQEGDKLKGEVEFVPEETPVVGPMAKAVSDLLKGGFLNATSVGFRPLQHKFNDERGGFDFEKTELLEFSIVPVPAHQDALQDAKSAGINVDPVVKWANDVIAQTQTITVTEPVPQVTSSVVKIEMSDAVKALIEKMDDKLPPVEFDLGDDAVLEVDFDPTEIRLSIDPDPEPEIDIDAIQALIRTALVEGVHEKVGTVVRDRVNALRGRVD